MSDDTSVKLDRGLIAGHAAMLAAAVTPVLAINAFEAFSYGLYDFSLGLDLAMLIVVFVGWCIALPHLVLAVPLFFWVKRIGWFNWATSALSGALIGAVPVGLLMLTMDTRLIWLPVASLFATCGLVAGLTFRAVLGKVG